MSLVISFAHVLRLWRKRCQPKRSFFATSPKAKAAGVDIVLVEYEPGQFSLVIRSKRRLSEAFLDELKHMFARHWVIANITVNPAESK